MGRDGEELVSLPDGSLRGLFTESESAAIFDGPSPIPVDAFQRGSALPDVTHDEDDAADDEERRLERRS